MNKQWTFSRTRELYLIREELGRELQTDKIIILELGGYDSSKKRNFTLEQVGEDNLKVYFKKIK